MLARIYCVLMVGGTTVDRHPESIHLTSRKTPTLANDPMTTRRDFLKTTAGAALLAGALPKVLRTAPSKSLDILVLGGTGFIGPHLVRYAVSRGHRVTIFTRGRHDAELPAEVIRLQGDRNGQLDSLKDKRWDVVIDDSATNPAWVELSTDLLKDAAGAYM